MKNFDWLGSIMVFTCIATAICALSVDRTGKFLLHPSTITILILISAVTASQFAAHVKNTAHPFISPAVLENPVLRMAGFGSFFMCMAVFGTTAFIPLYCQVGMGQTIGGAGRTLTAFIFGWILVSGFAARAYVRYSMRAMARLGTAILFVVFTYLAFQLSNISLTAFRVSLFFLGCGMGISFAPILLGVQSALPKSDLGSGTASLQLLRNLGGLCGVTLLGTLLMLNLNGLSPFLGGAGLHENPQIAMTRVFLVDAISAFISLAILWRLPPIQPKN